MGPSWLGDCMSDSCTALVAAAALNHEGYILLEQGYLLQAQDYFERALSLLDADAHRGDANDDVHDDLRATILNNLGLIATERGDLTLAMDYFSDALRVDPSPAASRSRALTTDNLAAAAKEWGRRQGPYWLQDHKYINQPTAHYFDYAERLLTASQAIYEVNLPHSTEDYVVSLGHSIQLALWKDDEEGALAASSRAMRVLSSLESSTDLARFVVAQHLGILVDHHRVEDLAKLLQSGILNELGWPAGPFEVSEQTCDFLCVAVLALTVSGLDEPLPVDPQSQDLSIEKPERFDYSARTTRDPYAMMFGDVEHEVIGRTLGGMSEQAARQWFARIWHRSCEVLACYVTASTGELPPWLYEVLVNRKGVVAERQALMLASTEIFDTDREALLAARADVTALDLGARWEGSIASQRRRHRDARRELDDLERRISLQCPKPAKVTLDEIRSALEPGECFLDIVSLPPPGRRWQHQGHRYVAIEVRPQGNPTYHVLGDTDDLDSTMRELVSTLSKVPFLADPDREASLAILAARLDLASLLPEAPRRLLVSPTRMWTLVPLSFLPGSGGARLLDACEVVVVPSARWLRHRNGLGAQPKDALGRPLVLGDPDYDLGLPIELGFHLRMRASRLKHSRREVKGIGRVLGVRRLTGVEATRKVLLAARRPVALHVATHGEFFEAIGSLAEQAEPTAYELHAVRGGVVEVEAPIDAIRGAGATYADTPRDRHRRLIDWLTSIGPEDQLSRSILALAGFNGWLVGEVADGGAFVSAAELAAVDLRGTELVVLSACDSGRSPVSVGDGSILGFRSATLAAGARTSVSALWEVADDVTADLMLEFYNNLRSGCGRAEALRAAQIAIRESRPDPFYWAGWALEGSAAPIPAFTRTFKGEPWRSETRPD